MVFSPLAGMRSKPPPGLCPGGVCCAQSSFNQIQHLFQAFGENSSQCCGKEGEASPSLETLEGPKGQLLGRF